MVNLGVILVLYLPDIVVDRSRERGKATLKCDKGSFLVELEEMYRLHVELNEGGEDGNKATGSL